MKGRCFVFVNVKVPFFQKRTSIHGQCDLAHWLQLHFKSLAKHLIHRTWPNHAVLTEKYDGFWGSESLRLLQWTSKQNEWHDVHPQKFSKHSNPPITHKKCDIKGGWFHMISSQLPWHSKLSGWAAWLAIESMGSWCRCLALTLTLSLTQADWIAWKNDQRQGQCVCMVLCGKRRTWISRINGWLEHRIFDEIWDFWGIRLR